MMPTVPTISEVVYDILDEAEYPLSIYDIARELGAGVFVTVDQSANIKAHIDVLRKAKRVVVVKYDIEEHAYKYAPIRRYFSNGMRIPRR